MHKNVLLLCMLFLTVFYISTIIHAASTNNVYITQLPGFDGTFPSRHSSGYINVDGSSKEKHLFYYFVESERNPKKDPVVLWLNGGPGCSSFDGFVYEHGPFNFVPGNDNNTFPSLKLNPYSWSKVSNIIYLDSPTGVGLSYSENQTAYKIGDAQTALDSHSFLLKWYKRYPEFSENPFYIAGESYAGIYIPTLAAEIVKGLKTNVHPRINFKGYIIGNGVTADERFDGNALLSFVHGMALISDDLYREFTARCGLQYYDNDEVECNNYRAKIGQTLDNLNVYDILEPCIHNPQSNTTKNLNLPNSFKELGRTDRPLAVRKRMFGRAWPFEVLVKNGPVPSWPQLTSLAIKDRRVVVPCTTDEVARAWLNDKSVRKAIHAKPVNKIGPWSLCMTLDYNHDTGSMIDYHRNLTTQGFRALIYSGDHDMCVPYTGTQAWTSSLGYQVVDEWRPWVSNNQVAGFTQGYAHNLTFLTIKGAGHTVPEYKPREALDFYSRWLDGLPI